MRQPRRLAVGVLFWVWAAACTAPEAPAQVYLSEADALELAFGAPGNRTPVELDGLLDTQRIHIKEEAGVRFSAALTRCWQGTRAGRVIGYACIDHMIGKTELITYLLKIDHPQGEIGFLELMVYRESEGGEVRHPAFRAQFKGKDAHSPLRLGRDLRNISGATLSARALAQGARKLMALYGVHLRDLPPLEGGR